MTQESGRWPQADHLVAVQLMCLSFAVSWLMGLQLFDARMTIQLDVWFQTDPDMFFSHEFSGNTILRHPNLGLFVGMPLTLAQYALGALGIGVGAPLEMQHWLMLLLAPLACAVRTLAAFESVRQLTSRRSLAIVLSLLDIAAFATVALGSVPDSFVLSAAALAVLYWLMATDVRRERVRWMGWVAVGTFAAGVTLSNVAPLTILIGATLLARGVRPVRTAAMAAGVVLSVVSLTAALAVGTAVLAGQPLSELVVAGTGRAFHSTPGSAASEVALAMSHTFIAPFPVPVPGAEPPSANPDYDVRWLLPTAVPTDVVPGWRSAFTSLVLALGTAGYLRRRATAGSLLPAAGILVTNFTLHLFWGDHFFVYALHWAFTMVWVVAGVAFLPGRVRTIAIAIVCVFLMMTSANSVFAMQKLLALLAAT